LWLLRVVMVPWPTSRGRKPLFLAGFAVLAARGFLYTCSDSSYWLVSVQLLDGVGARSVRRSVPLVVQDVTHGSGRFNISLGAITAATGTGAAVSNFLAGSIVAAAGYNAAFAFLGALAAAGFVALSDRHAGNRDDEIRRRNSGGREAVTVRTTVVNAQDVTNNTV
jgi:MFS family permease